MAKMELIDTGEVIMLLGVNTTQFSKIKRENADMPKPIRQINGNSCLWERKAMLDWIALQPVSGLDNRMALKFLSGQYV